jgi:glycogen operon protein
MFAAGDELGHSQQGNNNPYCQDNPITWIDWSQADEALIDFTAALLKARRQWLPLGAEWYGGASDAPGDPDLLWLRSSGREPEPVHWDSHASRVLGVRIARPARLSSPLLLVFNAGESDILFSLPAGGWQLLFDSASPDPAAPWPSAALPTMNMPARSVRLLGQITD